MATVHAGAVIDADDLLEILDSDLTEARLNNFINMAYIMTLRLAGKLADCGGDDALREIQNLLAAHYASLYERTTKSESIGGEWSVTYAFEEGVGLMATPFGQQAVALDCSGTLAKAGLKRARFRVTSYYQIQDSTRLFDEDLL